MLKREEDYLTESQIAMKESIIPQLASKEDKAKYIVRHHTFEKFERGNSRSQESREGVRSSMTKDEQLTIILQAAGLDMKEKSNHLIHSINKVTDLLKSNHELREQVDRKNHEKEEIEGKLFSLELENESLLKRISNMEACLQGGILEV